MGGVWRDGVVPIAVKRVGRDAQSFHRRIFDFHGRRVDNRLGIASFLGFVVFCAICSA